MTANPARQARKVRQNQKGFTLIELMIVVSIIGVLASLAVPAYKEYTIRSKMTEAASVFYPVKSEYTIYYGTNGSLPSNLSDLLTLSNNRDDFAGDYVRWLQVNSNGNVRLRTRNISSLGEAADKILEFRPQVSDASGTVNWTPFTREGVGRWIAEKYLPRL